MSTSPAWYTPVSDTVYCGVEPSSAAAGPLTDHCAVAPPTVWLSLIVVVTELFAPSVAVIPVVLPGLLNATR